MSRFLIAYFTILLLTGCKDNLERTYHSNGQLSTVGELANGKKEGTWISFNEQGDTLSVTPYLNGKEHGRVKYFENGVLKSVWSYENGVGQGEHVSFYPSGAIESRSFRVNGEPPTEVTNYYPTGELKQVMKMDGTNVKSIIQYHLNGLVEYEVTNPVYGIVTFYDSSGTLTLQATIIDGQMTDTISADNDQLPKWVSNQLNHLSNKLTISNQLTPSFHSIDLNGDTRLDFAIFVSEKNSKKSGILFLLHGLDEKTFLAGASNNFGPGDDDYYWADTWSLFEDKLTHETTFLANGDIDDAREVVLKNPAISIREDEGSGGLIYFDGTRFTWIHQGD